MKLKPLPRFILIALVAVGIAYGVTSVPAVSNLMNKETAVVQDAPKVPQVQTQAQVQQAVPVQASSSLNRIIEKGVVRVGVMAGQPPFFSKDGSRAVGFNVDFLNLVFAQPEFTARHSKIVLDTDIAVDSYEDVPKTLLKTDNRGNAEVDIAIDGLTFADGDLAGVVYSVPYVADFGYALIASNRSRVGTVDDVAGLTIGILKGDPDAMAYAKNTFAQSKIVELSDSKDGWMADAIKSGLVDAVMYDYPFAIAEIAGTDLQFAIAKLPKSNIRYKIAVRQNDADLLNAMNVAIRRVRESAEYTDLLRKHFVSNNTAAAKSASSAESSYVVQRGDTLAAIAGTTLGDKMRYHEIEARNNLPNPDLISVGQKLVIPKR
jgi:ABC-type amino acid transport substrate-binding protein